MMNVIDVAPGREEHFEHVFRTREGGAEDQEGFMSLEVLRSISGAWDGPEGEPASTYVVFTRWSSQASHDAWVRSEAFRRAHGRRRLEEGTILHAGVRGAEILLPAQAAVSAA